MNCIKSAALSFLPVLTVSFFAWTQPYPPTLRVAVTFYDFHSNASCPDFNPVVANDFAIPNMVQPTLDSMGFPVRGARVFYSYYVENWFRSSAAGEQVITNRAPVYGWDGRFVSENIVSGRNPYENIRIEDSLTFVHVGDAVNYPLGTYQYKNNAFFLLDGKGFGNEPTMNWDGSGPINDHNYSFTMMLKREFIYKQGMKFSFYGDDDMWVFINNRLVLDIGGMHAEVAGGFSLDTLAGKLGLTLGKKYVVAIFYAERQANSSHILITTNIISAFPNELKLIVEPNDTIRAGDTLTAQAQLMSDTGLVNNFPGALSWSFRDSLAFNHDSTFRVSNNQAVFIPTEAHTWVKITGRYDDNTNNIHISSYVWILVIPNVPDHCVIEASPNKPGYGTTPQSPLWDNNPLASVTIGKGQQSNEQFYAMLRDRFGNWIGPANPAAWSSADNALVFAEPGSVSANGQGRAVRRNWGCDTSTLVFGTYEYNGRKLTDDILVYLLGETVDVHEAYYFDNTADGYVDSIYVKATTDIAGGLTGAHVLEIVDSAIILPGFRGFTVNASGVAAGGFFIKVTEQKTHYPATYVTQDDKLVVKQYILSTGGEVNTGAYTIYDRVAPIIHWEARAAFLIDYMDPAKPDTLFIKFSEPVNRVTNDEPFYFLDLDNNSNYRVKLSDAGQPETGRMVFTVDSVADVDYMEDGDTLWIKETNRVCDAEGNNQNNNQNTRRRLYVKRISLPYEYIPQAVSPVSYQNMLAVNTIPAEITAVLGSELPNLNLQKNQTEQYCGMIIMVVPDPEDIGQFNHELKVEGTMTILDAVGNTLVLKQPLSWWENRKSLVTVWNLKNSNGRVVGPGMYVCLFDIVDVTDKNKPKKQVKKITIGVK